MYGILIGGDEPILLGRYASPAVFWEALRPAVSARGLRASRWHPAVFLGLGVRYGAMCLERDALREWLERERNERLLRRLRLM